VTTSVNVGRIEVSHPFNVSHKAGVILLRQHIFHQRGIGESVHDPWDKVTPEAVPLREVEHEVGRGEGSSLHTATSSVTGDVQSILLCSGLDVITVAAKASSRIEDSSLEDLCGIGVVRLRVQRPIPIPVGESIIRDFRRLLLFRHTADHQCIRHEVSMPEDEVADPVDVRLLVVVHRLMVVETIQCVYNS
jgi:hypothetical protein